MEPDSGLAQAITYVREHGVQLSLVSRQSGTPLADNACEAKNSAGYFVSLPYREAGQGARAWHNAKEDLR